MSEENVKVVKGMYEAFGTGDIPAVIAALDQNVEWLEAENFIYDDGNPYVGPNAVLEGVFMRIGTDWGDFTVSGRDTGRGRDRCGTRLLQRNIQKER